MKRRSAVFLTIVVLQTLLACGQTASTSSTPSTGPSSPPPLNVFTQSSSDSSIHGIECPKWLVLTGGRTTFTSGEIGQMADYVSQQEFGGALPTGHGTSATLAYTAVAVADPQGTTRYWNDPECRLSLEVTNTGEDTIQIPRVGLRLTADTSANTHQYPLLETCSLLGEPNYCGVQKGGGPPPCGFLAVQVQLSAGKRGKDFFGTPKPSSDGSSPCPEITLTKGASVDIAMDVTSAEALTYPIEPVLTVVSPNGRMDVPITSVAGFMSFAAPSQFTCSQVRGQSLVVRWSGAAAVDWQTLSQAGYFCA